MTDTKKIPCWLTVLLVSGLGISVSPHQVLTRTSEVSRALSPVLSSYKVIRMAPGEIERQVRTTGELRFRFNETDFYFNLEPHDMRASDYRAVEIGPGGVRRTLPPQPLYTFKGTLAGQEDTQGRFNLLDDGVEGIVFAPEGWYFVEPLRNYLPSAQPAELVVYRHSDIKPGQAWRCGVSLPHRLQRGLNQVAAQAEAGALTNYVVEVATEADSEYVRALGGSAEANREILGIMNQVEGVYQIELLLQLHIVFQHTWNMDDPYTATKASDLLNEFRAYWNANFEENDNYDLAHLWTGNEIENTIAGIAFTGVVCSSPLKYGLSKRSTSLPHKFITPAHEIGHNFGAVHPDEENPSIAGCTNTIMESEGSKNSGLTFCEFSRQQIATYVAPNNSCLTTQPITLQPPTRLAATAVPFHRIDLAWQDNSSNESGFIVQQRQRWSSGWTQIATTPPNATTFSDVGLYSDGTHRYRVQAFNDFETSAFSNGATATPLAEPEHRIVAGNGYNPEATESLRDVAVDAAGSLFFANTYTHRIRRVDPSGTITTVAGTGEQGYSGDGGPAVQAQLDSPLGVAVDAAGNLYIADTYNHRIRRVDPSGTITTVAGTGGPGYSGDGGPAVQARLHYPAGVAAAAAGNLYIADTGNHRILWVEPSGTITTVAGTGVPGHTGDGGPAVQAQLRFPGDVAVDATGNLYIADTDNDRIRRVDPSGTITTVAGTGEPGHTGDGGPAVQARLYSPADVAVDAAGNLYIADTYNDRIRRVDPSGTITTVADGLSNPAGVAVDAAGSLFIAEFRNHHSLWVGLSGTIAGLSGPGGVAVDAAGNLYITESGNHRILWVGPSGTITTVAGTGERGYGGDGGPAVQAQLRFPGDVAVDATGNLYIADTDNDRIRRVDPSGTITTVAGTGERGYGGDGGPAVRAQLLRPADVAVDAAGNLYIADTGNHRIRRVDPSGTITTVAGTATVGTGGRRSRLGYTLPVA